MWLQPMLAQMVKNLPAMREIWVWSLGWEDTLEEFMATHSSILAWRLPWTEEPGGLHTVHGVAELDRTEWPSTAQSARKCESKTPNHSLHPEWLLFSKSAYFIGDALSLMFGFQCLLLIMKIKFITWSF